MEDPFTKEERLAVETLETNLRQQLGDAWVERRVVIVVSFANKLSVPRATEVYCRWVEMLRTYGSLKSVQDLLGNECEDLRAHLVANPRFHDFLMPAGKDFDGRQVMWEHGIMSVAKGQQQAILRLVTLLWLAVHADLHTLRDGVTIVHTVAANDGKTLMRRMTRSTIAAMCTFPLRPQKILVAGLGKNGTVFARQIVSVIYHVTRTKLLERLQFVNWETLWQHVPHESIPTYKGVPGFPSFGGYAGETDSVTWIESRLALFPRLA